MTRFRLFLIIFQSFILAFMMLMLPAFAQDESNDTAGDEVVVTEEEFTLTDEELDTLLKNVDRFFINQDMANLTLDLDIIRDPSHRLNEDNIRESNPARIAGLSTIIGHYAYSWPGFYELKIMGQVLASSELPPDQTFFSQILPLPGSPIYSEELRERFRISFQEMGEVDGIEAYKIRYNAVDRESEFFNYITYFISVEEETLLRVESSFDNGWYVGSGQGNFYYDHWLGKYLPIYGNGTVVFQNPVRRFNVWGRWYRWNWETAEEAGIDSVTGEAIVVDAPEIEDEDENEDVDDNTDESEGNSEVN